MKKKLNIAVLMGGKSPEHNISLMTGRQVVKFLDDKKYNVLPVLISKDGLNWQLTKKETLLLSKPSSKISKSIQTTDHLKLMQNANIDVFFVAMHGKNGEDGTVQGFLELLGVPYTGSKVLASALGMDKIYSRELFTRAGLKTPKTVILKKGEQTEKIYKALDFPVFVKPSDQGSSVGVSKANSKKDLEKSLDIAYSYSNTAIIEEYIKGTEVTCGILGNEKPKALPLVEIVTEKEFFDWEAKYSENLTQEIVPARVDPKLAKKAQNCAIKAYKALGCRGFGRIDMILKGNDVYVLEANTIPGLTEVSLLPKAAKAAGIPYPKLLEMVINFALEKK